MKKLILIALIALGVTAQSQTTVPLKVTGTVVATASGTQAVTGTVSITGGTISVPSGTISAGGFATKITNTPTISASPDYSSGDNIGGINTITNAMYANGASGFISELDIWDKAAQAPALIIDIFDTSPSGTYTDNSAEVIAGDHAIWLGSISVAAGDWATTGAVSRVSLKGINLPVKATGGTRNLLFTVVTTSTPNYASTSDLVFKFGIIQNTQ
jgi:hypothetical protein